ncbi:uncharacterized protein LOC125222493 isoform X7 [Salvia hispanica]|uniref:uncharacterized protein LOC125222493 isoform X7 n=1 Tax=Salvia hispanica TaxID=49212 RepID=UPI0020096DA7|nr:uncharacterized protein LOC125222493 isoform X7 [Salvia hispanica]
MAATAYASLVSLLNTMDQIQAHPRLSPNFYSCQLQSLGEIVDFLVDFVVNYSEKAEIAMGRIGDIAHEAEHMIEVAAADLIRDRSTLKSVEKMLEQMIQEMSSIKEEMIKFKEESVLPSSSSSDAPAITMPTPPLPRSSSSSSLRAAKNTMLGFNHHVDRLLEELIGHESRSRRIIPIVGMGGAGQHCPPQLEGTAKKIVGKCRGLPLAICVIGGLLRKSTGTQEYWEEIAKDKSLVLEYSESELGALKSTWKTIGRRFVMSPHLQVEGVSFFQRIVVLYLVTDDCSFLQMHKMERGLKNLLRRRQCGSFYSNGSSIVLCYVMLCVARY